MHPEKARELHEVLPLINHHLDCKTSGRLRCTSKKNSKLAIVPKYRNYGICQMYSVKGELHRLDGAACIYADGRWSWHYEGKFHRENGPAVRTTDGILCWFKHGKLHRVDGPAIEDAARGFRAWYLDDVLSREEGVGTCTHELWVIRYIRT